MYIYIYCCTCIIFTCFDISATAGDNMLRNARSRPETLKKYTLSDFKKCLPRANN